MSRCKLCGDSYISEEDLYTHHMENLCSNTVSDTPAFVCIICQKRFTRKFRCKEHQEKCIKRKESENYQETILGLKETNIQLEIEIQKYKEEIKFQKDIIQALCKKYNSE